MGGILSQIIVRIPDIETLHSTMLGHIGPFGGLRLKV